MHSANILLYSVRFEYGVATWLRPLRTHVKYWLSASASASLCVCVYTTASNE